MEIIDRLSAGDPEKKKYYIRLFLDTLEPELENLRGADTGAPQEPIRAILHKLKSQVQTIGAADAHAMMSAHEQTIKGGGTISQSELDTTCDLLSTLIQNLQDLLK
ncbi:MAG: Hpt domain-containing protein [Bacteroidota bacterium]|nr:Hpt domain-containing protein [Bacteroidota bacterium]